MDKTSLDLDGALISIVCKLTFIKIKSWHFEKLLDFLSNLQQCISLIFRSDVAKYIGRVLLHFNLDIVAKSWNVAVSFSFCKHSARIFFVNLYINWSCSWCFVTKIYEELYYPVKWRITHRTQVYSRHNFCN